MHRSASSIRTDAITELDSRCSIQNLFASGGLQFSEAIPIDVHMWHLHGLVIRVVAPMFQNVDAHHQSNRFAVKDSRTVVNLQDFMEIIPSDQEGT
jgi:hypothetical protein